MSDSHDRHVAPGNLTRREMIKGVIAAGAVSSASYLFRGTIHHVFASAPGSVERLITLNVNGQQRAVDVMQQATLGKKIQTIEGLAAADGTLHPVQQGVVEEQGFQCAFCMSGFIMATVGFLKVNPNPTRAELAHGISGNLCRCQDYEKILTAFMRGAELSRGVKHA